MWITVICITEKGNFHLQMALKLRHLELWGIHLPYSTRRRGQSLECVSCEYKADRGDIKRDVAWFGPLEASNFVFITRQRWRSCWSWFISYILLDSAISWEVNSSLNRYFPFLISAFSFCCHRLSPTAFERAINPGRDISSYLAISLRTWFTLSTRLFVIFSVASNPAFLLASLVRKCFITDECFWSQV